MNNVEVDLKFLANRSMLPIRFKNITFHLIFDVKFDLARKARYVGGGNLNNLPASMSYSSVLPRDPVIIMFLIGTFND